MNSNIILMMMVSIVGLTMTGNLPRDNDLVQIMDSNII